MVDDFQEALVGAVDVFELDIQDGIDPVFAWQDPEPIFPAIPRKESAVATGCLPIQVQFGRPPATEAVLELDRAANEPVPTLWFSRDALGGELQIPRLLHLMRVRDEKRSFGGPQGTLEDYGAREHHPESGATFQVTFFA